MRGKDQGRWVAAWLIAALVTSSASATLAHLDISSAFDYDIVGTSDETTANSGNLSSALGDHNYLNNHAYTDQNSITTGIALPADGILGNYQLGPYDNGTDYLTRSHNAIALRTWVGDDQNDILRTVTLMPAQQAQYTGINLAFVNRAQSHGSNSFRTRIYAGYTDGTTETILDTGLRNMATSITNTGMAAGVIGSGGLSASGSSQGGFYQLTDNLEFENQAPNYSGMVRPKLLLGMDHRLNGGTVGAGTAAIWELESFLEVDSTRTLESIQIQFQGPWSNANRPQQLYVLAISAIPEPGAVSLLGVGALVVGFARRRRIG